MKAIVVERSGPPEHLHHQEMPDPRPKSDEILVRTTLTSLNYADIQARRGATRRVRHPRSHRGFLTPGRAA